MPRCIVINSLKSNEENKSSQKTKQDIMFKGVMNTTRLIIRNYLRDRRQWRDIIEVLKDYSINLESFIQISTFLN